MQEIANCIRTMRQKHRMTQAELAQALGVQYQTVSKWETEVTVPDVGMLPRIADYFGISMDELFGRKQAGCTDEIPEDQLRFLLRTYSQMYGPEAGPWNVSVENKYLMYRFAEFFEKNFQVRETDDICNIGIGAGEWDEYLSWKLKKGTLTSIDRLEICCRQLEQRLIAEENPNKVRVIRADAGELALDEGGYIIAGESTQTEVPGVYAAGDVRTKKVRQIITAAADGASAAHHIEEYLLQN